MRLSVFEFDDGWVGIDKDINPIFILFEKSNILHHLKIKLNGSSEMIGDELKKQLETKYGKYTIGPVIHQKQASRVELFKKLELSTAEFAIFAEDGVVSVERL